MWCICSVVWWFRWSVFRSAWLVKYWNGLINNNNRKTVLRLLQRHSVADFCSHGPCCAYKETNCMDESRFLFEPLDSKTKCLRTCSVQQVKPWFVSAVKGNLCSAACYSNSGTCTTLFSTNLSRIRRSFFVIQCQRRRGHSKLTSTDHAGAMAGNSWK